jgi:hypothetical protein
LDVGGLLVVEVVEDADRASLLFSLAPVLRPLLNSGSVGFLPILDQLARKISGTLSADDCAFFAPLGRRLRFGFLHSHDRGKCSVKN